MAKKAFTTSDIARICRVSRDTIKRLLEKGIIRGYRVGASGHWRVLPKDLALFMKNNNIPFPEPEEIGIDLKALKDIENAPIFCWEFNKDKIHDHIRPEGSCEDCLVYRVRSINCHALREEVGHKKIYCIGACDNCDYFRFQVNEGIPEV
jgi:excisionase family DNA binding protein